MINLFKKSFSKTIKKFSGASNTINKLNKKIKKDILEDILIESDIDYDVVEFIIYYLPPQEIVKRSDLRRVMLSLFNSTEDFECDFNDRPFVDFILGTNGVGKTTTIAKLANLYKKSNRKVLLTAGDTFRAAAIEQLKMWGNKLDIPVISTKKGYDSSAIIYDSIISGISKSFDNIIIDTAGRLHNNINLIAEIKKNIRVCSKAKHSAPNRKIVVVDATQGNFASNQIKEFDKLLGIDAIIITKLDGTAKGGAIFSIAKYIQKPILYIGNGEKEDALVKFDKYEFVNLILDCIFLKDDKD